MHVILKPKIYCIIRKSILVGRLADQGAMIEVLNTLYELHMPVLAVDCIDSESSKAILYLKSIRVNL
jgi:hypothetical protein